MVDSLPLLSDLKNTYFIIRHGQSQANVEGIVISHPENGVGGYGLTEVGKEQVRRSVAEALEKSLLNQDTVIISSDFLRARETAEGARNVLLAETVLLDPRLRERYFGRYERKNGESYDLVWERDRQGLDHEVTGVESVEHVLERMLQLFSVVENSFQGKQVLLVSHGDPLQILSTAFANLHPTEHRTLPYIQNAEIRRLN